MKGSGKMEDSGHATYTPALPLPVPDPTTLTTAQLQREVGSLKELFSTRLTGMDKAITLLQAAADRQPTTTTVAEQVTAMKELMAEKFHGIATQIAERDVQTDKASRDVKSAVDAAFAAAKEAVGEQNKSNALSITKSEAATTKQIDGILELIKTNTKAADDKTTDIKDRITVIESHSKGIGDSFGWIVGGIGILVALLTIVGFVIRNSSGIH